MTWLVRYLVPAAVAPTDVTDLENDVTTLTGLVNTNTAAVTALSTTVSGHTTSIDTNVSDIEDIQGMAHFRAPLTGKAVANATWEAVTPSSVSSQALADFDTPTLTMLVGSYDIEVTSVFTGPSDIDFGVTYNGGSSWTTLATSITSPETISGVSLNANAQFGFYCNTGSGTLDSGAIAVTRA